MNRRRWLPYVGVAIVLGLIAFAGSAWHRSLLPESYDMAAMGVVDWGRTVDGRAAPPERVEVERQTPLTDLQAQFAGAPDVSVEYVAREEGGRYTVNGMSPGPVLRAVEGDTVEVTLVNESVEDGATLHWHGIDVPNAADGVAGVTQDAVMPGEQFVYRFVAQSGTYWYHSHQVSHEQVRRGLFGAVVVASRGQERPHEVLVVLHEYDGVSTLNGQTRTLRKQIPAGEEARVRVVNTDNGLAPLWVSGASFRVVAIDGREVTAPQEVRDQTVHVPAGGRVDLVVNVPEAGVRIDFAGTTALAVGPGGVGPEASEAPAANLDLLSYGEPAALPFDPDRPDRIFDYDIGRRPGFLDGRPGRWWTVNGGIFPDVPMYMVAEGELIKFRINNDSGETHPMHLHGHHAVVTSRNGVAASGSPWWVDSIEVGAGDTVELALQADNPGFWMDHCHNLPHATEGLVAHLMYAGVRSEFEVGGQRDNQPE